MHLTWWDLPPLATLLLVLWLLRIIRRVRRAGVRLQDERFLLFLVALMVANVISWVALDEVLPWLRWVTMVTLIVFNYGYLLLRLRRHLRAPAVPTLAREDPPGP